MRLAYLTTQYPAVSHTFIRREILEIERRGHTVLRLAIRKSKAPLADPLDLEEQAKTLQCLAQPVTRLLLAQLRMIVARPLAYLCTLLLLIKMGRQSDRGVLRHLAYLVEAAYFMEVLRRERVEHVHVHFGTNSAAVALAIRHLGGPSYSFTVHGPDEFDAPRQLDLYRKIKDSAFVVGISDFGAAQLRRWAAVEDWPRIQVIRCTVGDSFFNAASPVDPNSKSFVCVGRLAPQKGQLILLDAFATLVREGADTRLVLAGDGEFRPQIEKRIAQLGLGDRVEITGYISEDQVRRRILQARAFVLPSFAEGLPMVIMEAFALGRPVISTYIAGIPELVRPGENGWLIPAGNVAELAAAMRAALNTPAEQLGVMARDGCERVRDRHYTPTEGARLVSLFEQAVKGTHGEDVA